MRKPSDFVNSYKFIHLIVLHRKSVISLFIAIAAICTVLLLFLNVNYNMVDYLPPDAQSTKGLAVMNREFTQAVPNTSVMVKDITIVEALEFKERIYAVPGVTDVIWLDDVVDIKEPLEMADPKTVEEFYKDNHALFSATIAEGMETEATLALQDLIGEDNAVAGEAPDQAETQNAAFTETMGAMGILVPIIVILLLLSTSSWLEPLLFFINIGVAILINMGTSVFLGEISFMSFTITPILQLACSLDYAIFLIHNFADNRKIYEDVEEAMKVSMKESISTIAASAMTTLFGFLALTFMNFRIGADLGMNLAKGIVISFLCSVIFLPVVTLCAYRLIDKSRHCEFLPSFENVHWITRKVGVLVITLVCILIVPAFLGQRETSFVYGNELVGSRTDIDKQKINDVFGQSTVMAILVPRGDIVREKLLSQELEALPRVTAVTSYAATVGTQIPPEFLSADIVSQFYSENYARIIVYMDTPFEGDVAFAAVEKIQSIIYNHYGDAAFSVGQSANLFDMKNTVRQDNTMVNLVAIISIFFVLLVTFKSLILPPLLLITIETGIWVNLSIPYFLDNSINFMGYLVLSTVQLGATVDYAILLTNTYMSNRQRMLRKEAIHDAVGSSFKSVLVSGITLAAAGFTLAATSSSPSIADIGTLLGRGTLLSMVMVICFLPAMLKVLDGAIGKTTYKARFMKKQSGGTHEI